MRAMYTSLALQIIFLLFVFLLAIFQAPDPIWATALATGIQGVIVGIFVGGVIMERA